MPIEDTCRFMKRAHPKNFRLADTGRVFLPADQDIFLCQSAHPTNPKHPSQYNYKLCIGCDVFKNPILGDMTYTYPYDVLKACKYRKKRT